MSHTRKATRITLIQLSKQHTTQIVTFAKQIRVSVTALLSGSCASASSIVGVGGRICIGAVAVNLRVDLGVEKTEYGCFISTMLVTTHDPRFQSTSLALLSQQLHANIFRNIQTGSPYSSLRCDAKKAPYYLTTSNPKSKVIKQWPLIAWVMSSLEFEEKWGEGVDIQTCFMTCSQRMEAGTMVDIEALTTGGKMCVAMHWNGECVVEEVRKLFADEFCRVGGVGGS